MPTANASSRSSRTTRYLLAGGLAAPLFVLVVLLDGALRPGYQSMHRYGSELSLGDFGWIQITNFIVTGVALCGFAFGLRRAMPTGPGSRMAPILAGICGAGLLVAGTFSMDPSPGFPVGSTVPEHPTLHGQVHGYAPMAVFLSLAALTVVLARRFATEPARRPWMWCSIAAGILVPATFVTSAALYDFTTQTGHYHGLFQRISLTIGFGWLGALALRLLLDHTSPPPANAPQQDISENHGPRWPRSDALIGSGLSGDRLGGTVVTFRGSRSQSQSLPSMP